MTEQERPETSTNRSRARDITALAILTVTAVLTAWSGFEASKWGGEMSIAFSRASSQRIEAARWTATADAARGYDLQTFALYVEAVARDDTELATFVQARFADRFRPAFDEWLATRPLQDPDAPPSPFALDSYQPPGVAEAAEADARADAYFDAALRNNQRGDNYTLLTVLFALVLFFTAMSERAKRTLPRRGLLVLAGGLFVLGVVLLATFPKIV
ncbi:hypothetical protein AB6N24_16250 [Cellulomonas sp. 179-A 4D5 NHS]|uniref:hypothetical protein n=1 Tax=Cellulomonas sp. 179-A 4D5 NHS TaxID=3142378 RepID=UPI0039A1E41D